MTLVGRRGVREMKGMLIQSWLRGIRNMVTGTVGTVAKRENCIMEVLRLLLYTRRNRHKRAKEKCSWCTRYIAGK